MEVVDSSVIINAALGPDPDSLEACRDAVVRSRRAIAQTAVEHGATLVSRDRRAMTHYALMGASFTLI